MRKLKGPAAICDFLGDWYDEEVFVTLYHNDNTLAQFLMTLDNVEVAYNTAGLDDDEAESLDDREWNAYATSLMLFGESVELTADNYTEQLVTVPIDNPDTPAEVQGETVVIKAHPWTLLVQKTHEPIKRVLSQALEELQRRQMEQRDSDDD